MDKMNGAFAFSPPSKKWFGMSAVNSSFTAVRGLALSVCSKRNIVVLSSSSVRLPLSRIAIMTFSPF